MCLPNLSHLIPSCTIPSGKPKWQEGSHQGVEEVMRRKNVQLPVVLVCVWGVSGTAAAVL
jgi:hypothetical protein